MSTNEMTLAPEDTETRTATTTFGTVTYESSAPSVATVDATGKVTAVADGTATITASVAADDNWNAASKQYIVTVSSVTVPDGALSGEFSVSATKKVYFSKGNLQAKIASYASNSATASEWKFADSQYSTIGNAAGNTSFVADTWVDLFSWVGNSATNDTYGLITFTSSSQANHGNVSGESLKTDWGTA
ncbi:MAG: Ig-like domain-containing protein, partial [Prevotella sp.]|nr:Ig-like domain-containing protein [Prevotella sp.]